MSNDYAYDHNGNPIRFTTAYSDRSGRVIAEDERGRRVRAERWGLMLSGNQSMKPYKRKQGAYK